MKATLILIPMALAAASPLTLAMAQAGSVARDSSAEAGPVEAPRFLAKAGASDLFEIQSGRLAVERARRAEVRRFAQMLVADHSRTTQQMAAAARGAGLSPPSPALEPRQREMIAALQRATPDEFDRVYLRQQIPAHEEALVLHRNYSRSGDTPALRQIAAAAAPVVERHLAQARQLAR